MSREFGSGPVPIPTEGIDIKIAQEEAVEIANRLHRVKAITLGLVGIPANGRFREIANDELYIFVSWGVRGPQYGIHLKNLNISGLGDQTSEVFFEIGNTLPEVPNALGISSRMCIEVGIHTDGQTLEQAEKLTRAKQDLLSTTYYFDRKGRFAKTVTVPQRIKSDAVVLDTHLSSTKTLLVPIGPSDFELAGLIAQGAESALRTTVASKPQVGESGSTPFFS